MTDRFRRVGMGYRFSPAEVGVTLVFSRVLDKGAEFPAEVAVFNNGAVDAVMTRQVNLKSSTVRGSVKELIDELSNYNKSVDWKRLMLEACESVIVSHRNGRPTQRVVGDIQRPPPPPWLSAGLLLKNRINCWLGAASTGKSTLAKAITAYYASGFRFLDRETEQGVPLYLDWEDDFDDFTRVTTDVCRNLGVWPAPLMLYRDMHGYKLRDQVDALTREIDREHIGLLVLDAVAAAGGSPGEHMSYETIALELEACLGALPPVTILALDHVTSAEHKGGGLVVPIKARGSERKVEFIRNQWSLVQDPRAAALGRHVVVWTHTKLNPAAKERPFATEIIHLPDEISIILRPIETEVPEENISETDRLLRSLAQTSGRTPRELALQVDGHEPSRGRVETVRKLLERAIGRGVAHKDAGHPPRYWADESADTSLGQGLLIPFPSLQTPHTPEVPI